MIPTTDLADGIAAPSHSRFMTIFVPLFAVGAMVLGIVLLCALLYSNAHEAAVNCHTNAHFYNSFEAVIDAVQHPPTLAGHKATPAQLKALHDYADNLRKALGPRPPTCG